MDCVPEMSSDDTEESNHSVGRVPSISDDTAEHSQVFDCKLFLEQLKSGKPMADEQMLEHLRFFYNRSNENDEFLIEKVMGNSVHYKRLSNVYWLGMQNMFFVPVWAAAFDESSKTGYVMFPSAKILRPLSEAVTNLSKIEDEEKKYETMKEIMRMVAAPIALALEALHTEVPHRRPSFIHNEITMDTVLLPYYEEEAGVVSYGEAKLKITEKTSRGGVSYPESQEMKEETGSRNNEDWLSYSILILEMISCMIDSKDNFPPHEQKETLQNRAMTYSKQAKFLLDKLKDDKFCEDETMRQHLKRYLAVVKDNLMEIAKPAEVKSDWVFVTGKPDRPGPNSLDQQSYYFEYPLCKWAATMIHISDDSYSSRRLPLHTKLEEIKRLKCQSCLLRDPVKLPLRAYRRRTERKYPKCDDEKCTIFYCSSCYTNKERLYCPKVKHGTTSSRIGHDSSYALIFYGKHYKYTDERQHMFKIDVTKLYNALTHSLICNIPPQNVEVCQLYGSDDKSAQSAFSEAVHMMHLKIHYRQRLGDKITENKSVQCINDQDYDLFIYYSGHGGPNGKWLPVDKESKADSDEVLEHTLIVKELDTLTDCPSNPECNKLYGSVGMLFDACYPERKEIHAMKRREGEKKPTIVLMYPQEDEEALITGKTETGELSGSEMTEWFCRLLRSDLHPVPSKSDAQIKCSVCTTIKTEIKDKCDSAYINGKSLKSHYDHKRCYDFETQFHVDAPDAAYLAYYHPEGVVFRVFPSNEGAGPEVMINFQDAINRTNILKAIKKKVPECSLDLLTKHDGGDSLKYLFPRDECLKSILEQSSITTEKKPVSTRLLYYHAVKSPVQVEIKGMKMYLNIGSDDLKKLVKEWENTGSALLPNILVQVVNMFYQSRDQENHVRIQFLRLLLEDKKVGTKDLKSEQTWDRLMEMATKATVHPRSETDYLQRRFKITIPQDRDELCSIELIEDEGDKPSY